MLRSLNKSRLRCLELAVLVTLLNVVLSLCLVWYSTSSSSPFHSSHTGPAQDSRLLLSVEYPADSIPASSDTPTSSESTRKPAPLPPQHDPQSSGDQGVRLDTSQGVFDKSRMFKSHMFSVVGDDWATLSSKGRLCLGAQTSVDRLYELEELVASWSGPISIAVFTPDKELAVASRYISFLRSCRPGVARQVSFHLSYPAEHPGLGVDGGMLGEVVPSTLDCGQSKQVLKTLLNTARSPEMMAWRESYPYPQNLLRNMAKTGCQTNYTYIPDIDMVPGYPTMYQELEEFLERQEKLETPCSKCAYVIPTYEIASETDHLPANKTELLRFVKEKKARQFHEKLYSINQKSSNLQKWEKIGQTDQMEVAYMVDKYIFKYEPLYVARGDTPLFDERFIGFGMTRNTQVYEMYVSGYTFHVLNNAFTSHRGFQSISSRPPWRAKQQELNNGRFDEFAKEISAHYSADPYNMLDQLKKMNLKHVKVAYAPKNKKKDKKEEKGEDDKEKMKEKAKNVV